jgi:ribosomal protein S18 acetylase RimI-like enzyme
MTDCLFMEPIIRPYRDSDAPDVVQLSLRAWAPVFASELAMVGAEIFERLNGQDWRIRQRRDVEDALANENMRVWVADVGGRAVGFVAAKLDVDDGIGEIYMLAVDPDHQRRGLGSALTDVATDWIRDAGLPIAVIDTAGDDSHAPARRTYEKAGYRPMPIVRHFKAL